MLVGRKEGITSTQPKGTPFVSSGRPSHGSPEGRSCRISAHFSPELQALAAASPRLELQHHWISRCGCHVTRVRGERQKSFAYIKAKLGERIFASRGWAKGRKARRVRVNSACQTACFT
eukprot:jgi/Botrbrau1/2383/Bobra.0395s0015.1